MVDGGIVAPVAYVHVAGHHSVAQSLSQHCPPPFVMAAPMAAAPLGEGPLKSCDLCSLTIGWMAWCGTLVTSTKDA